MEPHLLAERGKETKKRAFQCQTTEGLTAKQRLREKTIYLSVKLSFFQVEVYSESAIDFHVILIHGDYFFFD